MSNFRSPGQPTRDQSVPYLRPEGSTPWLQTPLISQYQKAIFWIAQFDALRGRFRNHTLAGAIGQEIGRALGVRRILNELNCFVHRRAAIKYVAHNEPKGQARFQAWEVDASHPHKKPRFIQAILTPHPDVAIAHAGIASLGIRAKSRGAILRHVVEHIVVSANDQAAAYRPPRHHSRYATTGHLTGIKWGGQGEGCQRVVI